MRWQGEDGSRPKPTSSLAVIEPELDRQDAGDRYWVNNPKVRNGGYHRRYPRRQKPRLDGSALLSDSFNFDADDDEPDPADWLRDRAVELGQPYVEAWLDSIESWLQEQKSSGSNLEEIRGLVPELFSKLDPDGFARHLQQMTMLADLVGQDEVGLDI